MFSNNNTSQLKAFKSCRGVLPILGIFGRATAPVHAGPRSPGGLIDGESRLQWPPSRPAKPECRRTALPTYARVTDLDQFEAPWARVVRLQEIEYEGGVVMMRMRIREGRRITDLELTVETARHLAEELGAWAKATKSS